MNAVAARHGRVVAGDRPSGHRVTPAGSEDVIVVHQQAMQEVTVLLRVLASTLDELDHHVQERRTAALAAARRADPKE